MAKKPTHGGARPGAGRKSKMTGTPTVPVSVRVPASLVPIFRDRVKKLLAELIADSLRHK